MSFYETAAEEKGYYFFKRRGDFDTPAHFHGSVEFLFVESGEQEATVNGEKRILRGGEACFCNSFSVHSYARGQSEHTYVLLGSKEHFEPVFALFGSKVPPTFFRFRDFELLRTLSDFCSQDKQTEAGRYAAFDGAVKIILAAIAENTPFVTRSTDKQSALVNDILRYADGNPQNDLTLRAVAKTFGYSHEHLSRILHKYLAENWNSFVNRLRVRRAHSLLQARPDASVLGIAYDCGFESPNTFYRAYKKEFGKNPRK